MPDTHPTFDQLAAFDQGRLMEADWSEVERHLADCTSCCAVLETAPGDSLVTLVQSALRAGTDKPTQEYRKADTAAALLPASAEVPAELAAHPRYRVQRCLGAGGMGAVFLAEHLLMERPVALKVIHRHLLDRPEAVERFRREVKAAARLSHPNIVTAYDAEEAGGVHFLVMEYVEGATLDKVIRERGRLPVADACDWIRQAALGLQHAHERGMVHRDIKPGNLLVRLQISDCRLQIERPATKADGLFEQSAISNLQSAIVKIADFGLSRLTDLAALTPSGAIMGTPDYIAPEQALTPQTADIRADIYSLGCTLYHLLTGRTPFPDGTALQKLILHQERKPIALKALRPDVPEGLVAVVERMLAKEPAKRYQTPAEVALTLTPFVGRSEGEARECAKPQAVGRIWPLWGNVVIATLIAGALLVNHVVLPWFEQPRVSQNSLKQIAVAIPQAPTWQVGALEGIGTPINRLVVSGDCRRLLTGDKKGAFKLWKLDDLREIATFPGHEGGTLGMVFSADNKRVLTGGIDGMVRLWDLQERKAIKAIPGHQSWVRAVAFSPDEKLAVSAGNDGFVILWDLVKGDEKKRMAGHEAPIGGVAVSPDGKLAVTAGFDETVRLWDLERGEAAGVLTGHKGNVAIAVFTHKGDRVISGGADGTLRVWSVARKIEVALLHKHSAGISHVAVSPDDRFILAAQDDKLRLWDLNSAKEIAVFRGHEDTILGSAFHPDGMRALSAARDGTVRLWQLPER